MRWAPAFYRFAPQITVDRSLNKKGEKFSFDVFDSKRNIETEELIIHEHNEFDRICSGYLENAFDTYFLTCNVCIILIQ